jgi:magnesium chelatase family protein
MLARRLPGLLPPLAREESLEVTRIWSVSGRLPPGSGLVSKRPFRSPHHGASAAALAGGGADPKPGELSLAHFGVLFLDELPEFRRDALEALREPLEEGTVSVARAAGSRTFPARFLLVAAMNPCPCGFRGDPRHPCRCSEQDVGRYRRKISGPLLDRIDLHVEVPALPATDFGAGGDGEPSATVRARVVAARGRQLTRTGDARVTNGTLSGRALKRDAKPEAAGQALLERAVDRLGLSARAYHRVLRVARTIADLDGSSAVGGAHVAEALRYRPGAATAST